MAPADPVPADPADASPADAGPGTDGPGTAGPADGSSPSVAGSREDAAGPGGRWTRRTLVLTGLAALCAVLAVAAIVLGLQLRTYSQADEARDGALRAAKQSALNLTSIDSGEFDDAVSRVLEGATGEFRTEFEANSDNLKKLLADNEVSSDGKVLEAGLVRADKSNATALVVVDSTVKNTASPEGRVNTYRMQVEVERVDGRWLTSSLRFVG